MYGCRENSATEKPFTKPIRAPIAMTISRTTGIGSASVSCGQILDVVVSRDAVTTDDRPTILPAEISVPASTIHPAIPKAIGSFAAVRDRMLMIEAMPRNFGRLIAT